jgi:hypothetical protein
VLLEEFNPQNTACIPVVKFFIRLELFQHQQSSNTLFKKIGVEFNKVSLNSV